MKDRRPGIRSYVLIALLCFLIAKLGFTSIFVCTKRLALPVALWESSPALAKDDEAAQTGKRMPGSPADRKPQAPPDAPDLLTLQDEITSLAARLKGIKAEVEKHIQTLAAKTGISLETLERKRTQIEAERHRLEEERKRLNALKQEIDIKLSRMTEIQNGIQSKLGQQKALGEDRIKHLIKIYTTMPPKKAAALIEKLEMEVIIALFSKMKGENVGQILPYVSAEKAAGISERLAKLGL